jgi:ring-1,2-phenylacetyl-CoA epoxidase subunit PaaD
VITEARALEVLSQVKDPEIPTCSITDLGIVERVEVDGEAIEVDLVPTFAGCPALDVIREDVTRALESEAPDARVVVRYVMSPAWTTDRIAAGARAGLEAFGISPPVLQIGRKPLCPYCGSADVTREGAFGPTPCRAVAYCNGCSNPFESFKTK